ncbi:hypothetical protein WA158_004073 [Blastocystis sp. Blastoise]
MSTYYDYTAAGDGCCFVEDITDDFHNNEVISRLCCLDPQGNTDFQKWGSSKETGFVESELNDYYLPVASMKSTYSTFNTWFTESNNSYSFSFPLIGIMGTKNLLTLNYPTYFPLTDVKGGYALSSIEEYIGKKCWFTMKTNLFFLYENRTDQFIDFETNNGLWVFINKHLFLDYGGYNTPVGSHINITNYADKLGLIPGITYSISIFFASRTCGTQSKASLYKYMNVLQLLLADVNLGKDDILDVLFQQCLNTQTLRLSLFLLQHICTVILLTNKDIDIFYEAVHNNRIYESIQATTIICQLLPLFPNQQREYLQSLLLNTCDNICISKLLVLYLNDIPESQPIPDSIRNSIKTVGDKYLSVYKEVHKYELNSIPQDIMYTLLTRIAEIIQIARCPSSYIPPQLHTLKKINSHSISFNMSHNSLEEVYSPPFPPPPTNYFTGAYKDTGNDLMDDDDMEVPEEEEIGLMNTYEEKERGEGEEKPIGELIYELNYILNTVEIEAIGVQYAYSLLRNRLKTANKEEKYDVNMILYGNLSSSTYMIFL